MKRALVLAIPLLAAGLAGGPANAAGCLKGAAIGGVAGHFAGHHGLLGAGAGCLIGHHEASKHARERAQQQQQGSTNAEGTAGELQLRPIARDLAGKRIGYRGGKKLNLRGACRPQRARRHGSAQISRPFRYRRG